MEGCTIELGGEFQNAHSRDDTTDHDVQFIFTLWKISSPSNTPCYLFE